MEGEASPPIARSGPAEPLILSKLEKDGYADIIVGAPPTNIWSDSLFVNAGRENGVGSRRERE